MKRIISLLLASIIVIFAFVSCQKNDDNNDDNNGTDNTPTTENATIEGFISDMETALTKLVTMKKGTISFERDMTISLPQIMLDKIEQETGATLPDSLKYKVTVTFNDNDLRIYGTIEGLESFVEEETDFSFDIVYINETLYISIPAVEVYAIMNNLTAEDIQSVIDAATNALNELLEEIEEGIENSGLDKDAIINIAIVDAIIDAIKSIDLTQCEDFEGIAKEVFTNMFPIALEIVYGENWRDVIAADGLPFEEGIDYIWEEIEKLIPEELLAVLNSDDVIGFLTSDFSEHVDFTKTTDSDITYKLTIKKSLFEEIVKVVKATLLTFDIDVPFEISIDDIVFSVVLDSNKNLKEISSYYNVSGSVMKMTVASSGISKITVSPTPETISAPDDTSKLEELDKEKIIGRLIDELEHMFDDNQFKPGENVFDGYDFIFEHVEIILTSEIYEMLENQDKITEEELIEMKTQEFIDLYKDEPLNFGIVDYYYDGYNLIMSGVQFATFDGHYLIIDAGVLDYMVEHAYIYFVIAEQ